MLDCKEPKEQVTTNVIDVVSVWEDVTDDEQSTQTSSPLSSQDNRSRKRRGRTQLHTWSASSPHRATVRFRSRPFVPRRYQSPVDPLNYVLDILNNAMNFLRYPFAMLIALWILIFILTKASDAIRTTFCRVPVVSHSSLCGIKETKVPRWADYPRLVDVQSSSFEQLLDESVGGSELSLGVKKAEIATSDLVTLVRFSGLNSRDTMAQILQEFVSEAKVTGRGLQKLSSKVGGAVDSILAVNDHALRTIEAHLSKSKSALSTMKPFSRKRLSGVVTKSFTDAMNVLSTQLERVIIEAQVSLANLDCLEQKLVTLQDLLQHENHHIAAERSELLAELWTILGGNGREIRNLEGRLDLLRNIGHYRTRALAHVAAALQTLQSMNEDMEDLRERVAAPELVGKHIPVEVHMSSIKAGLERLSEKRYQAKKREELAAKSVLMQLGDYS